MKVAVLECEYIPESDRPAPGEYTRLFARTEVCPYTAFTIDRTVLALQGHPEFTPQRTEQLIRAMPEKFPPEQAQTAAAALVHEADRARVAGRIARFFRSARRGEIERLSRAIQYRPV